MHPSLDRALAEGWRGLSLYVLGPGVGECQVVVLPDGKVMVVDACVKDGRNLGVELLRALRVTKVDLFVVTHPDQDHVRGAAGLLQDFPPRLVWTYPEMVSLRDLLVRARKSATELGTAVSDGLDDLTEFALALDRYQRPGYPVERVRGTHTGLRFPGVEYAITPIAPTDEDEAAAAALIERQYKRHEANKKGLVEWVEKFIATGDRPGDHPNLLSIALAIEIDDRRRIVLGGDVEAGEGKATRGWPGVMASLALPGRTRAHLLRCADVVKVAHHGSKGAFHEPAWAEHTARGTSTFGVIAPYSRQKEKLPRSDGLAALRGVLPTLAITATTDETRQAAVTAGWRDVTPSKQSEDFPMVALRVPLVGPTELSVWGDASVWAP